MIYGYIRVSTDKQTVENQRFEVNNFCEREKIIIDRWIEETISGTKEIEKRQLGKLLKKLKKGDILICAELSRLGRSLLMIMSILHHCMKNEIQVWTIKDNFRLGKDIQSQVLAFAFGLSAQIERDLISMRTKEALARKKAEGVILGRPRGTKNTVKKLTGMEKRIKSLLDAGISYAAIGRMLGVHRLTVSKFVLDNIESKAHLNTTSNEMDLDPITEKQLNVLVASKDIILHLLSKKKSTGSIAEMYKVEPFVVSIFKQKYKNEKPENTVVIDYETKQKEIAEINHQVKKLNADSDIIRMLFEDGRSKESIASMYNVSIKAVMIFSNTN